MDNIDFNQVVASSGFSEKQGFLSRGAQTRGHIKPGLGLLKDFQFRGVVFNSPWTEMKSATWSQFNKTDASAINKCSFCF